MKTPFFTKTCLPSHSIKLAAVASLLCNPMTAWSSPTLVNDSYVSLPFVLGVRHGSDPNLLISNTNTGFLQFSLTSALPTDLLTTDINKATLKFFVSKVNAAGSLTIRQVQGPWTEASIPKAGVSPVLSLLKKVVKINKSYQGRWVQIDVTNIVKEWVVTPASNRGVALSVRVRAF